MIKIKCLNMIFINYYFLTYIHIIQENKNKLIIFFLKLLLLMQNIIMMIVYNTKLERLNI